LKNDLKIALMRARIKQNRRRGGRASSAPEGSRWEDIGSTIGGGFRE